MADSQVKTANICNITSSTELRGNGGGTGTFLTNNSIKVYCNGSAYWSGVFFTSGSESLITGDKYTISFTPYCTNNNTIQVQFCGVADNYTFTSGIRKTITVTAVDTIRTVAFYAGDAVEKTIIIKDIQIEKGETATVYHPYSATGWVHSLRKMSTATEAVENPLYSDGTAITTYTLKGNTTQSGTPTPSNPVDVNGVGDRTENLFDGQLQQGYYAYLTGEYTLADVYVCTHLIPCTENTTYTFRCINTGGGSKNYGYVFFDSAQNRIDSDYINELTEGDVVTHTATTPQNTAFLAINIAYGRRQPSVVRPSDITDFMLNTGSTAKPFEPYGYKIPILNGQQTTNIYLGSTQTVRKIGKIDLSELSWTSTIAGLWRTTGVPNIKYVSVNTELGDGIAEKYTIHTGSGMSTALNCIAIDVSQVSVNTGSSETPTGMFWYALATPETGTVNEPLMKIGTYADTLSNATTIPTAEGANSITVDTTVQPSEFTATWTGWHDASVKEKSENLWNEEYPDLSSTAIYVPLNVGEGNFTLSTNFQAINNTTDIFLLSGNVTSGISSSDNGAYAGKNVTKASIGGYVTVAYRKYAQPTTGALPYCEVMLNSGSTALPYAPYWE